VLVQICRQNLPKSEGRNPNAKSESEFPATALVGPTSRRKDGDGTITIERQHGRIVSECMNVRGLSKRRLLKGGAAVGFVFVLSILASSGWAAPASEARGARAEEKADYTNHLNRLRAKLPPGFTLVWQAPFFVVSDEPPAMVRSRATNTVHWAVTLLKRDYFTRDPVQIIDIWLFRDKTSYEKYTRELFNDTAASRFGYYSRQHRSLFMNISTGAGTLVHEIVHPFMEANFPACPPWYNEGLASLFEASTEANGHIRGMVNWRLKGLEKAIQEKRVPPFEKLMALDESEFYGGNSGYSEYYAQARYLCYYLQERELLISFHREFVANAKQDPTGVQNLKKILKVDSLESFRMKWQEFILKIRNP
jgi:hypothetical protein